MKRPRLLWGSLLVAFSARAASADDAPGVDLEDLLNMRVEVASKKEEPLIDAPGAVTIHTDGEIRDLGYFTLRELASITPGYSAIRRRNATFGLETRGMAAALNERHLVLLDGMPINHPRNNSAVIDEELPLLFARRVEMLRGPASALYGIGAVSGVISVTTAEPDQPGTIAEGNLAVGLEEPWLNPDGVLMLRRRLMAHVLHRAPATDLRIAIGYSGNEASLHRTGVDSDNPFRDEQQALFLYFDQKARSGALAGLGYGLLLMERTNGFGEGWARATPGGVSDIANSHTFQSVVPFLRYNRPLGSRARLSARAKGDFAKERGTQSNTLGWWTQDQAGLVGVFQYDVLTDNVELVTDVAWDILQDAGPVRSTDVIAGAGYDVRWQDAGRTWTQASLHPGPVYLSADRSHTLSAYLQWSLVLALLGDLKLTAGVRSDQGFLAANRYFVLSPRLALVQRLNPWLSLRAMYGSALRAPGIDAHSHNEEKRPLFDAYNRARGGLYQLRDLGPETMESLELGLAFETGRMGGSVGVFSNRMSNELRRADFFPDFESDYFQNVPGQLRSVGGELELRFRLAAGLRAIGNLSYARARTQENLFYPEVPVGKMNLVLTGAFPSLRDLRAALMVRAVTAYTPSRGDALGRLPRGYRGDRGRVSLDATARLPLGGDTTFGLELRELLGRGAYAYWPDAITPRVGRTGMLTVDVRY